MGDPKSASPTPAPAPGLAEAESGPACLFDPWSTEGLRREGRRKGWRKRLFRAIQVPGPAREEFNAALAAEAPTLAQVLLVHGRLLPKPGRCGVATVERERRLGRAVAAVAGDWSPSQTADILGELRALLLVGSARTAGLSRSDASRALTMVRRAANRWRAGQGMPELPRTKPTDERAPARPPALTILLVVLGRLIELAAPPERARIALVLGCGLTPGQVRRLRGNDLRSHTISIAEANQFGLLPGVALAFVRVRRAKRERWIPIPPWATALLLDTALGRGREALILGGPSLEATLRRLGPKVPGAEGINAMAIRRTWQRIALDAGLPREIVRGTWSSTLNQWPSRWHRAQRALWHFAGNWTHLESSATAGVRGTRRVARKAPSGCAATRRETLRKRAPRPPAPLPDLAAVSPLRGHKRAATTASARLIPKLK